MPFDKLLSPIVVGAREIRNRVVVTAHSTSEQFRNPPLPAEPYIDYLRRRAAGGVGLIIAQPHYPNPFTEVTEEALRRHRALASAVRSEGATILLQLAHLGLFGRTDADPRRPGLWAFDDGQSEAGEAAHRMTDEEVERMVEAYRQTAVLAREAGFDGVEVHGAHGYLIQQSLTPRWNHRDDRWGGDRTAFARRIIAEARAVFGSDGIVGYRTATDDLRSPEDEGRGAVGIATDLERILGTGQIDLLNTTVGDGGKSYARAIPSYRYEEAPNIPFIVKLRKLVDVQIPVVGVGRIVSPAAAEAVLQSGACDLVAMTRANIADPDLVTKAAAGMGDRIRPCVGASVCVDRKLAGFPEISCFHNPEVLREAELAPRPTSARRRILVVGAEQASRPPRSRLAAGTTCSSSTRRARPAGVCGPSSTRRPPHSWPRWTISSPSCGSPRPSCTCPPGLTGRYWRRSRRTRSCSPRVRHRGPARNCSTVVRQAGSSPRPRR